MTVRKKTDPQVTEAIKRMEILKLHKNAIDLFEKRVLLKSIKGILFTLSPEEIEIIEHWEKETGNVVYHVIFNVFEFGTCYSFLYVSKYEEEWHMDNQWLREGFPMAYVYNKDVEYFSEYRSISIIPIFGGVERVA